MTIILPVAAKSKLILSDSETALNVYLDEFPVNRRTREIECNPSGYIWSKGIEEAGEERW